MAKIRIKRESKRKPEPELQSQVTQADPDEASKESFPASDSPASNAGHDPPWPEQKK
jgi:hypothetical protein